jgi:predicted branched-subunit amino acid permease
MSGPIAFASSSAAFRAGVRAALTSVFFPVISGTYIGVGALAHGFGFAPWWLGLSTVFMWAAPAQVILISALGGGSPLIEAAIAVTLSAVRLLPMVVALLPQLRGEGVRLRDLLLPAHFTAVSMWVESLRLLPMIAHERRVAYCNGVAVGFMSAATGSGFIGYYLAAELPPLLAGALLFLTPLAFLMSTARNARQMMDKLALALGLVIGPLLAYYHVGLDLMWTGVIGGALAYVVHRLRGVAA